MELETIIVISICICILGFTGCEISCNYYNNSVTEKAMTYGYVQESFENKCGDTTSIWIKENKNETN